ncbi:MAG: hypothetical protein CYG60_06760 [Actinobacteria bacterium]|nr:MAG: hypothetical protein CYG60_06760 [Actinomycetota bacterium]
MEKAHTSCAQCLKEIPSMKPLRPRSGRYAEGSAGPVRVLLGGVEEWWCFPRCWKKAHPEKPGKAKRKKPIKLRGSKTTPLEDSEAA